MEENTTKAIAINTVYLYIRLAGNAITMLLTTRVALQALGAVDFGLFSVLGGISSFIILFNTIMLTSSNRFIAVAIGKGDKDNIRDQFNVNLIIHIGIAVFTLLFFLPLGNVYVMRYLNFDGDLIIARNVLNITIVGSVVSFLSVPYNGLLMAKEKFSVFCITDVIAHLFKLLAAISILFYFEDKLIVYACGIGICSAIPTFVYYFYCNIHYKDFVKFKIVKDKKLYSEVFSFSVWVGFGAFATIGRSQGASLLVNLFFNTLMNTALGIAQSVNALITTFAQNVTQPMAPQITKTYASGNMQRCTHLLVMNTKMAFLAMLLISSPFIVSPELLLKLWLGEEPAYAKLFLVLLIVDNLIGALNSGVSVLIFATGKIRLYQILVNLNRIMAVFFAYVVLKMGGPAYSLLFSYITFTIINLLTVQWVLHKTCYFDNKKLLKESYYPCLLTVMCVLPVYLFKVPINDILWLIVSILYIIIVIWIIGLSSSERNYITDILIRNVKKLQNK